MEFSLPLLQSFVKSILKADPFANIVVAGDFNEFVQTRSVFSPLEKLMTELDVLTLKPAERYTYVFDQNTQQLDHMFVSNSIKLRDPQIEHVHVNNWAPNFNARISDHDPSVARIRVCGA